MLVHHGSLRVFGVLAPLACSPNVVEVLVNLSSNFKTHSPSICILNRGRLDLQGGHIAGFDSQAAGSHEQQSLTTHLLQSVYVQDAFLPAVEAGDVTLIGATTENPSFELNAALLSRCRVFTLSKLQPEHIKAVLQRALSDEARGLASLESLQRAPETGPSAPTSGEATDGQPRFAAEDAAIDFLAGAADGDARAALNALEMAAGAALERASQGGGRKKEGGPLNSISSGPEAASPVSPSGRTALPLKLTAGLTDGAFGSPVEGAEFPWQHWDAEGVPPSGTGRASSEPLRKSSLGGGDEEPVESGPPPTTDSPPRKGDASGPVVISLADVSEALQRSHVLYDKTGEEHYNVISALHKSMRGGDVDAALYWLARMLRGGEGPLYVARRLVRFASEDVGLADPNALPQAVAAYQACHFLGERRK